MVTGHRSYAGLQTRLRILGHLFHMWLGYCYYISNPTLELDSKGVLFSVKQYMVPPLRSPH